MKILIVHNAYGKRSGEEVVVDGQHEILTARGHAVERFEKTSEGLKETVSGQISAFFSALGNRDAVFEFRAALERFQPDVVHVHNLYPWISPAILPECAAQDLPVVMTVHNYRLMCPNGLMFSRGEVCERCAGDGEHWCVLRNCEGSLPKSAGYALRNLIARKRRWYLDGVDRFGVLTDFQMRKMIAAGFSSGRIMLLPNTTDIPNEISATDEGDCLGFIGRVSPEKGVSFLLEAMRQVKADCKIAGAFDKQPDLPDQAPANVEFLGMLDKVQLTELHKRLRFVVAPSIWYEGFPMAIVEAMAQGKPVIASRIGGIPEIVDDGVTGLLFEPGNADDLAMKIQFLWDCPELCREMGEAGRAKVQREYSEDRYYERLMTLYAAAIASRQ